MKTTTLIAMMLLGACGTQSTPGDENAESEAAKSKPLPTVPVKGSGGASGGSSSSGGSSGTPTTPTACYTGTPTVDQSNLGAISMALLGPNDDAGQTLIASRTGVLTGVELSVFYCGWNDPKAQVMLEIRDAKGDTLAEAEISAAHLPQACSATPLSSSKVGAAFFDLSTACVHVTAGEQLSLFVAVVGEKAGTCDTDSNVCTAGRTGSICFADSDCESGDLRASMSFDSYSDGMASMDEAPYSVYDLTFKTFIK